MAIAQAHGPPKSEQSRASEAALGQPGLDQLPPKNRSDPRAAVFLVCTCLSTRLECLRCNIADRLSGQLLQVPNRIVLIFLLLSERPLPPDWTEKKNGVPSEAAS